MRKNNKSLLKSAGIEYTTVTDGYITFCGQAFDSDISLVSGRYKIDAKSIMGIFSLDLSKPIDVVFEEVMEGECETLYNRLKELNIAI